MTRHHIADILAFLAFPWTAFVAAFLYYVALTAVAISVSPLSDAVMAVAYLAPLCAYAGLLILRGVVRIASTRHLIPTHA